MKDTPYLDRPSNQANCDMLQLAANRKEC